MGRRFGVIFAVLIVLMFAALTKGYGGEERKIVSATPYSAAELKSNAQILIKERPSQLNDEGINAIFKEVASRIKTFDGEKYDKFNANLILESGGLVAKDIWNFQFIYNLEGMRNNKTETWQLYIELTTDGNKVIINQLTADRTLVPDKYIELGRDVALKNLDEKVRARTPEVAGSKWIMEGNGTIVLTFKDPNGSATTDVTLDLNEKIITNIEKHYWGETFNLRIIEAFVNPGYEPGFSNSGNAMEVFIKLKTDALYGCANYKIIANTTRFPDKIIVGINGIQREKVCLEAMGPAVFSEKLGELRGGFDLVLRYEDKEDKYRLIVSDKDIKITPLNFSFTHIDHPLYLLRIPENVVWTECGHYGRAGCEKNSEYISICQKFFNELEEIGAEPYEPENGTYAFDGFNRQDLRLFKFTGDNAQLEMLVKKYSAYTNKDVEDKEKCTLVSINTWKGDWFYSWDQRSKGLKTPGFKLTAGIITLLVAAMTWKKSGGLIK